MTRAREENDRRRVAENEVFQRLGVTVTMFERRLETMEDAGIFPKSMLFKLYTGDREDVFVVVKADSEGGPVVAFGGGMTLGEALRSTLERMYNGSIKWKADEYADRATS